MFTLKGLSKFGSVYTHKFPGAEAQTSRTPQGSAWMPQEPKARVRGTTSHLQKEIKKKKIS